MAVPNYASLPDPNGLKFQLWASVAVEQLVEYGISVPPDETLWQDWAASFSSGVLPGAQPPNPYGFRTWQDWAQALIGTLA